MVGAVDNFNRILALMEKERKGKEKSTSILSKILGIDYTPCIPNSDGPTLLLCDEKWFEDAQSNACRDPLGFYILYVGSSLATLSYYEK